MVDTGNTPDTLCEVEEKHPTKIYLQIKTKIHYFKVEKYPILL